MTLADSYRRKIESLRADIAKLLSDKAREAKKVADAASKIATARAALARQMSDLSRRSKVREIERFEKKKADAEKKIGQIEDKIAKKEKAKATNEKSLATEQSRAAKQAQLEAERQTRELGRLSESVSTHSELHRETQMAIEQLRQLPEKITVVAFASNPVNTSQLRLDAEVRSITEAIRKSDHRDSIDFHSCWAVQPLDLLQAMNQYKPQIIHFSGHGTKAEQLVFEDDSGRAKFVEKAAIIQTMVTSGNLRLVFLNSCYSAAQAESIVEHVEAAVGMSDSVGDKAATIFSSQFYSAIGFGLSVQTAFDQAIAALMLEGIAEEHIPALFLADGVDGNELILVRPPENSSTNDGGES